VTDRALKRTKTSRAVADYVQQEIFEGRLRPGDRVDVEQISSTLEVSPTPVREALLLLERDGLISTRVHRSARVEHFDARTLRADFHVFGLLSGVAVARVAKDRDPEVVAELRRLLDELEATPADQHARVEEIAAEILRVEHRAGATPRLRAELEGFSGFVRWLVGVSDHRRHPDIVDGHARVIDAIVAGASRRASQCRLDDARAAGEQVISDLLARGVLADDGTG
jgi:DNA-binding GntR family transcriptional regulator